MFWMWMLGLVVAALVVIGALGLNAGASEGGDAHGALGGGHH